MWSIALSIILDTHFLLSNIIDSSLMNSSNMILALMICLSHSFTPLMYR